MPSVLLVGLVLLINLFLYGAEGPLVGFRNAYIATHLYYGVMILAGRFSTRAGQYSIFALTTIANLVYVVLNPNQFEFVIVALIYPFVALSIVRTIWRLKIERQKTDDQLADIDSVNTNLAKQIHSLSTLFDISQTTSMQSKPSTGNLNVLLDEITQILAEKVGIHRLTLRIWTDNRLSEQVLATVGLTPSEIRRGEIKNIEQICQHVLDNNEPVAILHKPGKICPLPDSWQSEIAAALNKDQVAAWCLPIRINQNPIGTLTLDKAAEQFSVEEDLRILTIVSSIMAQRVEIQQMFNSVVEAERMAALGKMATTIAHEVRNPLGGIRGAAQLLELELTHSSDTQSYLNIILKEVDRLNRVVGELLVFGRPYESNFQQIDLRQMVIKTLELCKTDLEKFNIEVIELFQPNLPMVELDQDRIQQVILNLCRNAIESMSGEGQLILHLNTENSREQIELRLEDTGKGIDEEIIPYLFDPFFTTKLKGTGIGLALSHQIMTEHGGQIRVDVTKTDGAAFIMTLPIKQNQTNGVQ